MGKRASTGPLPFFRKKPQEEGGAVLSQIELSVWKDGKLTKQPIAGHVYGDFAAHKSYTKKGYRVTHLPSGLSVSPYALKRVDTAKRMARLLGAPGGPEFPSDGQFRDSEHSLQCKAAVQCAWLLAHDTPCDVCGKPATIMVRHRVRSCRFVCRDDRRPEDAIYDGMPREDDLREEQRMAHT